MPTPITYADSGVDVIAGDEASRTLYEAARRTWVNRDGRIGAVHEDFGRFFSDRGSPMGGLPPGSVMGHNQDGIGSKVEIAERVGDHTTMAQDLLAMVCDDASVRGKEPLWVGTTLSFGRVDLGIVRQLAQGLETAARLAQVAVTNGELAELPGRVLGYHTTTVARRLGNAWRALRGLPPAAAPCYNWEATVTWIGRTDRRLGYERVKPGQAIVTVREHGFRSNGLSLVRRIAARTLGPRWHEAPFEGSTLGRAALTPSGLYTPFITAATGGFEREPQAPVHAMAHVTGGGIPGKLGRVLSVTQTGAHLDNLFPAPAIMARLLDFGPVDPEEAFRTWNMGNGLLAITDNPDALVACAQTHGLEAQVAGAVTRRPAITILPPWHGSTALEFRAPPR